MNRAQTKLWSPRHLKAPWGSKWPGLLKQRLNSLFFWMKPMGNTSPSVKRVYVSTGQRAWAHSQDNKGWTPLWTSLSGPIPPDGALEVQQRTIRGAPQNVPKMPVKHIMKRKCGKSSDLLKTKVLIKAPKRAKDRANQQDSKSWCIGKKS